MEMLNSIYKYVSSPLKTDPTAEIKRSDGEIPEINPEETS